MRRGFFNFDRVVYRFYQDETIALEAFKAGEFDLVRVYGARIWMRQHRGPKWDDGRIVKHAFAVGTGQGLQSYQINSRRAIFQDIRVREAIGLSLRLRNEQSLSACYKRANSVFNNSDFAAQGLPSAGELRLLEPYRKDLPAEVFGPVVRRATHRLQTCTRCGATCSRRARCWRRRAGSSAPDGKLRNARGEAFEIRVPRARRQRATTRA